MDRIRRLDAENIIVVTNNVAITPELVDENRAACRRLMQGMDGPVVIVIDYREAQTTFGDMMNIIRGNAQGKRKDLNQRAFSIFVGNDKFMQMYRDAIAKPQFGSAQIPIFDNMDDAFEAARLYLQRESERSELAG